MPGQQHDSAAIVTIDGVIACAHRRHDARGERGERGTDQLEHARLIGRALRDHCASEPSDRPIAPATATSSRPPPKNTASAPAVTPCISVDSTRPNRGGAAMIASRQRDALRRRDLVLDDRVGERVDLRELAHVELAALDPHHPAS